MGYVRQAYSNGALAGSLLCMLWVSRVLVFIFAAVALMTGCSHSGDQGEKSGYEGLLVPGVWEKGWTDTLTASLTDSQLLAHEEPQIEDLCPGYTQFADKRLVFWQQLLLSLSWKESLHGPGNWVRFNSGSNDGLFQINPDLKSYYGCDGLDLFNANDNIKCAVKMAKKLVDRYSTFLTGEKGGMAAYWQPLRADSAYNSKNREYILNDVREACRTRTIVYHCSGPKSASYLSHVLHEVDRTVNADVGPF